MEKENNHHSQTLCIEEIVKQRPILTEEEMDNFYSFDEAVEECMRLFDEGVDKINQEYALRTNSQR